MIFFSICLNDWKKNIVLNLTYVRCFLNVDLGSILEIASVKAVGVKVVCRKEM